jgi:type IV secretion system protein VirD4
MFWISRALIGNIMTLACRVLLILACCMAGYGLYVITGRYPGLLVVAGGIIAWRKLHHRGVSDSYGSATVATMRMMERGGLLADNGLILGRCVREAPPFKTALVKLFSPFTRSDLACRYFLAAVFSDRWLSDRLIRVNNHVHLLTCSPAGGGKGVAALIPNLLSYRGNCVIVDPKGELFKATAKHRRNKFGKKIYRLDPFNVCGPGGDTLNPFDFIDARDDDFLDDCRAFANQIIIREGDEKQPHFNDMAELNLTALTAFVCACEHNKKRRHLGTLRGIASTREIYNQAVEVMSQTEGFNGVIRRLAGQIAFPAEEEQSSVLSTFARQTNFLDSPPVAHNVSSSSFDPLELKHGNADLYLILPHHLLSSLSRLQRLWIGTVMRRATEGPPTEHRQILWLLDEMAHIGRMQVIEDAVTLYRGMGMRLWFIFQCLEQLNTCFGPKASSILDNIGTQQYFAIKSYQTAEALSQRIGDTTRAIASDNVSDSDSQPTGVTPQPQSGNRSRSTGITYSEISRRLVKPEEILTLDHSICLILHRNLPVVVGRLVRYFDAPEFRWGGSARPRRLGLAAAFLGCVTLATSTVFAALAVAATQPRRAPVISRAPEASRPRTQDVRKTPTNGQRRLMRGVRKPPQPKWARPPQKDRKPDANQ